ncbi:hypothetical protein MMC13_006949 [Lambiella insularis]|nr:hypothetical protein [Lambiella insularis]
MAEADAYPAALPAAFPIMDAYSPGAASLSNFERATPSDKGPSGRPLHPGKWRREAKKGKGKGKGKASGRRGRERRKGRKGGRDLQHLSWGANV